jgi:hypothetical protein
LDAVLAVKGMLTVPPLHMVAVLALVMVGVVLVVTFTVCETGPQPEVASPTCTVYTPAVLAETVVVFAPPGDQVYV